MTTSHVVCEIYKYSIFFKHSCFSNGLVVGWLGVKMSLTKTDFIKRNTFYIKKKNNNKQVTRIHTHTHTHTTTPKHTTNRICVGCVWGVGEIDITAEW